MLFATVILPQRMPYNLTYSVSDEMAKDIAVGMRVEIPIGKEKLRPAVVVEILSGKAAESFHISMQAKGATIRAVERIIDNQKVVSNNQLSLFEWMAKYYMCSSGELIRHFLPKDIKKGDIKSRWHNKYLSSKINNTPIEPIKEPEYKQAIEELTDKPLLVVNSRCISLVDNYLDIAIETLGSGGQMLLLAAEDDMSIASYTEHLGDRCVVLNSKTTSANHYKIYYRLLYGEPLLIISSRKGLGLPFTNLKYVVVTNEHSSSYRSETAPHYNGKDVAVMLAHISGAKIVLDSFAPTIESYFNCEISKFNRLNLPNSGGGAKLSLINKYSIASKERRVYGNIPQVRYFSRLLLERLSASSKSLLFHNRRGFNSFLLCNECGWLHRCKHCNVSMTYHQSKKMMICHYCNTKEPVISRCPECSSTEVVFRGFGSENIEESISKHLPLTPIYRVDGDTLSSREEVSNMIEKINNSERAIVVGTALAASALKDVDFKLVCVIDADTLLNVDDFRAEERAYRTLVSLSARAKNGDFIIQASDISNPIYKDVEKNNYISLYTREIALRRQFNYPPFVRITRITLKHYNEDELSKAADILQNHLSNIKNIEVSQPITPFVDKVRDQYISHINIKFKRTGALLIKEEVRDIISKTRIKGLYIDYEVDA